MVVLVFGDPRDSLPALVALLPTLVPQVNAMIGQAQRQAGRPGGVPMLRLDAGQVPTADELTSRLFPSSTALTVDREGISLVTREPVPGISSPATSGVLIALLLPAVQAAREAARRHAVHQQPQAVRPGDAQLPPATNALPKPAITDKDGKPLLSWRVAILPYIEEAELYNKFKLDEPWDSPHNKALIKEMPSTYLCPSWPATGPGMTTYQAFVGPGASLKRARRRASRTSPTA